MIKRVDIINLYKEDTKKLVDFYFNKSGKRKNADSGTGNEDDDFYGFEFEGDAGFFVLTHSNVGGRNGNPDRYMVNFEVDNIDKEIKKLKEAGIKAVQEKYFLDGYGYVATFEDAEGNFFQLTQVTPYWEMYNGVKGRI